MAAVQTPTLSAAAEGLGRARRLVLDARAVVDPVADPGGSWTGDAARDYTVTVQAVQDRMSQVAAAMSALTDAASAGIGVDSGAGATTLSAAGVAVAALGTAALLPTVTSSSSASAGAVSAAISGGESLADTALSELTSSDVSVPEGPDLADYPVPHGRPVSDVLDARRYGEISQLVSRGMSVEDAAAAVGNPGMSDLDWAVTRTLVEDSLRYLPDIADPVETVDAVFGTLSELGFTGGAAELAPSLTLHDIVGVDMLGSAGESVQGAIDQTGLGWLSGDTLAAARAQVDALVTPWAETLVQGNWPNPIWGLSAVETGIARGSTVAEALLDEGIPMAPEVFGALRAAVEQVLGAVRPA